MYLLLHLENIKDFVLIFKKKLNLKGTVAKNSDMKKGNYIWQANTQKTNKNIALKIKHCVNKRFVLNKIILESPCFTHTEMTNILLLSCTNILNKII